MPTLPDMAHMLLASAGVTPLDIVTLVLASLGFVVAVVALVWQVVSWRLTGPVVKVGIRWAVLVQGGQAGPSVIAIEAVMRQSEGVSELVDGHVGVGADILLRSLRWRRLASYTHGREALVQGRLHPSLPGGRADTNGVARFDLPAAFGGLLDQLSAYPLVRRCQARAEFEAVSGIWDPSAPACLQPTGVSPLPRISRTGWAERDRDRACGGQRPPWKPRGVVPADEPPTHTWT